MRTIERIIAENITRIREDRGISQKKLAEEAKISHITLNRVENFKQRAGPKLIRDIAKVLNVDPNDFYKDASNSQSSPEDPSMKFVNAVAAAMESKFALTLTKDEELLLAAYRDGNEAFQSNLLRLAIMGINELKQRTAATETAATRTKRKPG